MPAHLSHSFHTTNHQKLESDRHLGRFLAGSLRSAFHFGGYGLDRLDCLVLELLGSFHRGAFLTALPEEDPGDLNKTNTTKEEVDGGEAVTGVRAAVRHTRRVFF